MTLCDVGMFELCKAEQDLAVGETETGEKIEDVMSLTVQTFFDRKIGYKTCFIATVEPLIKDALNKGHLCIKDTFRCTNLYS